MKKQVHKQLDLFERRKQKDFWSKLLVFLNAFAWILVIIILFVFHRAQPEFESFFDRFYQIKLRTTWDVSYIYNLLYMVICTIPISFIGLGISLFRARRKSDSKIAFVCMGIVSFLMLIIVVYQL